MPLLYCSWSDKTQDSERCLSYLPKCTELFLQILENKKFQAKQVLVQRGPNWEIFARQVLKWTRFLGAGLDCIHVDCDFTSNRLLRTADYFIFQLVIQAFQQFGGHRKYHNADRVTVTHDKVLRTFNMFFLQFLLKNFDGFHITQNQSKSMLIWKWGRYYQGLQMKPFLM